jgi:GGDEF domain-containing protein
LRALEVRRRPRRRQGLLRCDRHARRLSGLRRDRPARDRALSATRLDAAVFDEIASVGLPGAAPTGRLARLFGDGCTRHGGEDRLTQLPDREAWIGAVDEALATRSTGTVLVLDIVGLAAINAEHGTRVGDYVLTQLARAVAPHGIAGRVGGDEIALYAELPRADAEELAASIARHVGAGFAQLGGVGVAASFAEGAGAAAALLAAVAA